MASPAPPLAPPLRLPEPRESLPVDSTDESSDFDQDDLRDSEHWNGQPWEVIFPSDSPLWNTTYETAELAFDALKDLCIRNRMSLVTLRSQKNKANTSRRRRSYLSSTGDNDPASRQPR
ncbi:hypothetical protein HRG_014506 [Hirsutella rhossiliensis]